MVMMRVSETSSKKRTVNYNRNITSISKQTKRWKNRKKTEQKCGRKLKKTKCRKETAALLASVVVRSVEMTGW